MSMLIAYNEDGEVIATLDFCVVRDSDGNSVGSIDFEETEALGTPLTQVWQVSGAVGSGSWPEKLGATAHDLKVEVDPKFSISKERSKRPERRIKRLVAADGG